MGNLFEMQRLIIRSINWGKCMQRT